jgi:hypothetical protein
MTIIIPAKRKFLAPPLVRTVDDWRDPLNLGLVGHWSMDAETINGTRMLDLSGRDNHGTLGASPSLAPGRVGQTALSLNGTSQYVATPTSFASAFSAVTYSFWVNLPSTSMTGMFFEDGWHLTTPGEDRGVGACVGNGDGDTPGNHLLVPFWGVSWQDTGVNIGLGWRHVAVALSGGKTNAYLNGARIFVGSSSIAGPSTGTLTIGRDNDTGGFRYLNAQMDDVRVYNRALTPAEVFQLYADPARDRVPYQTRGRVKAGTGLSAITGTLAVTEANDTIAAVGRVAVGGTLAVTEQADTIAAAGAVRVAGTLASTEQPDTLAATGTVAALGAITGTLSAFQAVQTLIATGQIRVNGGLNVTQAAQTLAATGIVGSIVPPPSGQSVQVIVMS